MGTRSDCAGCSKSKVNRNLPSCCGSINLADGFRELRVSKDCWQHIGQCHKLQCPWPSKMVICEVLGPAARFCNTESWWSPGLSESDECLLLKIMSRGRTFFSRTAVICI